MIVGNAYCMIFISHFLKALTQLAGAVEYANCISAEG